MNSRSRYYLQLKDAESAIQRVRELHRETQGPADDVMCEHCFVDEERYYQYPCPTIQALEG